MANVNSIELKANLTEPTKPTNQTKQEQWAGIVKPWRDQTYRSSGIGAKWCRSTNWVSGGIRSRRQLQLLLLPTISFPATSLTQQSQRKYCFFEMLHCCQPALSSCGGKWRGAGARRSAVVHLAVGIARRTCVMSPLLLQRCSHKVGRVGLTLPLLGLTLPLVGLLGLTSRVGLAAG